VRLLVLAAAMLAFAALQAAPQERITVFAAASLKNALDEANAAFPARIATAYAASSALARQIEAGAPAQLFISADDDWMNYLEKKDRLAPGTRRTLLGNRLAWVVPAGTAVPANPLDALKAGERLAIADPRHVPAGKYARAALENLGVWPAVSGKLAAAENVRAALALVARGEAPLGIVYVTDAREEPRVLLAGRIDPRLHPAIVYPVALVRGAPPQAGEYLAFLFSAAATAIFEKHGFTRP
jgi:molybdate transport system substrate-binding protein